MEQSNLTQLLDDLPRNDTTVLASAFELVSDYALRRSADYGDEIAKIQPYGDWARERGLSGKDLGVDRVVTTHDGSFWAIQNKGYAIDTAVRHPDMSTFILAANSAAKLVPGFTRKILVTSGPGLTANASAINRGSDSRVVVLNRHWLEEATDYPTTYAELLETAGDQVRTPAPFILREDQKAALHNIVSGLRHSPEVQCIMACGTGKTMLSEAVATALGAKLIVFFVPSLGLMRQTIRSWDRQRGAGGMHKIAVCSDDSVGKKGDDAIRYTDDDIPCEVLHDSESIAKYIAEHVGPFQRTPVVVFCTYHSEHLVVEAQHRFGAPQFDFAFCDEAHFLVGTKHDGGRIGELVKRKDDSRRRLKARHRVYATATPRLLSQKARARLDLQGAKPMDSMDDGSPVFGPVAHTLTFGEAITLGILCNYQVSIIAVPEQKYADFINERAYVEADDGYVLDAQTFAAVEALRQCHALGSNRVITYHNRVSSARAFAELVDKEPGLPSADAIWGELSSLRRDERVARMNQPGGHVLTNVRCLNEGVDIPALDAIMFVDPKSSPIDIAQSTGRALRTSPGKTLGRIIIPVAVPAADWDSGELSEAERDGVFTEKSPYKAVFEVLNALSNHDETIRHILTALRLGLGKRKDQKGIDRDELPDTPAELEDFIDVVVDGDGHVSKSDKARVPAETTSVLGGGKVVLRAAGMTDAMREQFAAAMRLMIVKESSSSSITDDDHIYNIMVYGFGYTWAEADKRMAQMKKKLAAEGAAA